LGALKSEVGITPGRCHFDARTGVENEVQIAAFSGSGDSQRQLTEGYGVFPRGDYSTATFRQGNLEIVKSHRISLPRQTTVDVVAAMVASRANSSRSRLTASQK
jgi:hypothetical protein